MTEGENFSDYPENYIWQDLSSYGEDGLMDIYIKKEKWKFLKRDLPFPRFSLPEEFLIKSDQEIKKQIEQQDD